MQKNELNIIPRFPPWNTGQAPKEGKYAFFPCIKYKISGYLNRDFEKWGNRVWEWNADLGISSADYCWSDESK